MGNLLTGSKPARRRLRAPDPFSVVNGLFLAAVAAAVLFPFLLAVGSSFSDELALIHEGFRVIPRKFSTQAYAYLFLDSTWVLRSYAVTIVVTSAGTLLAMGATSMAAYTLSRRKVRYRNAISFAIFFTLIFHAGIVPFFVMVRQVYGLKNNLWALILPPLLNPIFIYIVRNYFYTIPDSLWDSAMMDGAGEFRIFAQIVVPVSVPAIASVSLFYALFYWNDWWHALLFVENPNLSPLQYQLFKIISQVEFQIKSENAESLGMGLAFPVETTKLAATVVTIGPIVLLYPYVQKYFIKGILLGSIKG
jgi:putative aldouronate transport system permease protein